MPRKQPEVVGTWESLPPNDGAAIGAWRARPERPGKRGLVLVQEIFGVTASMREVAAGFAQAGFDTLVPAFFDHIQPGTELAADDAGMARGREFVGKLGMDTPLRDVRAAANRLLAEGCERVGVVGYCWGGVVAYLSATRLGLPAVSYYGRLVPQYLHESPQAPLLFHFGARDELIPTASIDAIESAFPRIPVHRYDAGHAFNRINDPHFHAPSAALALARTHEFLELHLTPP